MTIPSPSIKDGTIQEIFDTTYNGDTALMQRHVGVLRKYLIQLGIKVEQNHLKFNQVDVVYKTMLGNIFKNIRDPSLLARMSSAFAENPELVEKFQELSIIECDFRISKSFHDNVVAFTEVLEFMCRKVKQ